MRAKDRLLSNLVFKVCQSSAIWSWFVASIPSLSVMTLAAGPPPETSLILMKFFSTFQEANKRRRFGYRRMGVLLGRNGMIVNHKTRHRTLYRGKAGRRASGPQMCAWITNANACCVTSWRAVALGFCV
jgi:putative transposase